MTGMDESKRSWIADDLRARVVAGEFAPSGLLPSERELAADPKRPDHTPRYPASRETIRHVLDQLQGEGLIVPVGRGRSRAWKVRDYDPLVTLLSSMERGKRRDNPTLALDDWAAGVREQGREPRQDVQVHTDVKAGPEIVESLPDRLGLRVEPGERVVLRRRKRWVDDRPVQTVDSWFPAWVAESVLPDGSTRRPLLEDGDVVLPEGILFAIGHRQVRASDRITARTADKTIQSALDLSARTVVLVHTRVGYDVEDRPVRLMVTIAPTDRNVLGYEMDL